MSGYARGPGRIVRWLLVGPLALAGLAGILAGGPALLLALGGNPLPEQVPSPGRLADLLTRPDDGQLLLWVLSVVGWVAWAVVAGSLLLELGAQLTGRRTPHLPGLSGPQRLANVLVAGVLAALTTPGIGHAQAAYLEQPPAPVVAAAPPALAQPPPFAQPLAAATAEASLVHEVDRGDWMWHIAGRYLGDEQRYPEIAALNPGYAERYPDYPDHIQPGDRLVLPDDARDRGERRHATGEPIGAPDPATGTGSGAGSGAGPGDGGSAGAPTPAPRPEPAPAPAAPAPAPAPAPVPAPAPGPVPGAPVPVPPPPAAGTPTPGAGSPPPGAGAGAEQAAPGPAEPEPVLAADPDQEPPVLASAPLLAAGVLASALVGALLLYRRRRQARRRPGRLVTHSGEAGAEATLRAAATADVARLDRALRLLASRLSTDPGGPARLPDVGAVWIGEEEIHLILAAPCELEPPAPFHASGPASWFLPAGASLPEVPGVMAPLPALVTVGSQPGQHLLVDLERMGMLTVTGRPDRCSDLLRYLVAELAHNPWSDQVQVTLAGFPAGVAEALAGLNPERIAVASSLPEAATELRRRLAHTTGALAAHGLTDAVHGRVSDTATDSWAPQLLLVNRPRPEHDELLTYLEAALVDAGRRCAVAVATTAPAGVGYGRRSIAITDEGLLKAGFLHDSHPLPAVALPEQLLGPLADLLRGAAAPDRDHPVPPAAEPWAAGTDATGGIRPAPGPTRSVARNGDSGAGDALRDDTPIQLPIIRPVPPAVPDRDGPAPDQDQSLDADLAAWRGQADQPPRVSLLGPVQLAAPGPPPTHRARVCQEMVVYLAACGERGAGADEISHRLWPTQQVRPTVRTAVIMNVRRWLGAGPDGQPWLSEATPDGRYRVRPGLLVDWHLFRRLRARGERRGPAGAEDLRTALGLVQGPPLQDAGELAGASPRVPYSWLPGSSIQPELILAGIVDTAHQLVELCLASGELDTARWAVAQAWLADARRSDDHPWRDLLQIARAVGDPELVREIVAELLQWRDAEHPDELAPATRRLIRSLLAPEPTGTGGSRP